MALIQCPECAQEVSDKAPVCPYCGYPINNRSEANITQEVSTPINNMQSPMPDQDQVKNRQSGLGIAALVLGIIGLLFSVLFIGIFPCILAVLFAIIVIANKKIKHNLAIAGGICALLGIICFSWFYLPGLLPQSKTRLTLNETNIINETIELTPMNCRLSLVVSPSNWSDGSARIHGDNDEDRPYQMVATIKNCSTSPYILDEQVAGELILNDENTYPVTMSLESSDETVFENTLRIEANEERLVHFFAFVPREEYVKGTQCEMRLAFSNDTSESPDVDHDHIYIIDFPIENLYNSIYEEKNQFYSRLVEIMSDDLSELVDGFNNIASFPNNITFLTDDFINLGKEFITMSHTIQEKSPQWVVSGSEFTDSEINDLNNYEHIIDNNNSMLGVIKDSVVLCANMAFGNGTTYRSEMTLDTDIAYIIEHHGISNGTAQLTLGSDASTIAMNLENKPTSLNTAFDIIMDNYTHASVRNSETMTNMINIWLRLIAHM